MAFRTILAQVACRSIERSRTWYAALFGRPADAAPMAGLLEWHLDNGAGLQVFENSDVAGTSTVTILIDDLDRQTERLRAADFQIGAPETGDTARLLKIEDPSGNLVVLAEPSGD